MSGWFLQFLLGLLIANAGEWLIHRYLLHGLGHQADSFWAYHLYEHHAVAKKFNMFDPGYKKWPKSWNSQAKEGLVLAGILALNLPFFWWANGYACAIYASVVIYSIVHRKAHCDQQWAKAYLPWHHYHHLHNEQSNWCISYPLFDYLINTYRK